MCTQSRWALKRRDDVAGPRDESEIMRVLACSAEATASKRPNIDASPSPPRRLRRRRRRINICFLQARPERQPAKEHLLPRLLFAYSLFWVFRLYPRPNRTSSDRGGGSNKRAKKRRLQPPSKRSLPLSLGGY